MKKAELLSELESQDLHRTWMYKQFSFWQEDEIQLYLKEFHTGFDLKLFFRVAAFKDWLIKKNKMSFPQFEYAYRINKRKALETMFQHRVDQTLVEKLEEKLTLIELYNLHTENSSLPLYRFVL